MSVAYLDCLSGISGDMFLGALLDLGLDIVEFRRILRTLPMEGYRVEERREARHHIHGTRCLVLMDPHAQPHRNLGTIRRVIRAGGLPPLLEERSILVFEELGRAEAKVHDLPLEAVHFHEIGAVDAIVDIVGTVFGLDALGIRSLFVSPLPLGTGIADSHHGPIPIPAPATLEILKGVPLQSCSIPHELVTPTGAALVKVLADGFGPLPAMRLEKVGYGVGSRDLPERPNLLRILVGDQAPCGHTDTVAVLETNSDRCQGEIQGYLMERLFLGGALDVSFAPVQMKKNRPGVQVQVMARPGEEDSLVDILFQEGLTLGVRVSYVERRTLPRAMRSIDSPWGPMPVKEILQRDGTARIFPEYEICRSIAMEQGLPLHVVMEWVAGQNATPTPP